MKQFIITGIVGAVLLAGCGGGQDSGQQQAAGKTETNESGLTEFEMVNGIGPIKEEIEIGKLDPSLIEQGSKIFETKCSACHKLGERYVGPALGDVLDRRTPTYVMNMVLNTDEMIKNHPEAKKKLAEFMTPMPNQNLSKEEARAVVEYFASQEQQQDTN